MEREWSLSEIKRKLDALTLVGRDRNSRAFPGRGEDRPVRVVSGTRFTENRSLTDGGTREAITGLEGETAVILVPPSRESGRITSDFLLEAESVEGIRVNSLNFLFIR